MICKKPFIKGSATFPCGQCIPCRLNRRRLWTHRILLEAMKHEQNCFITLTYAPDFYPANGSLNPRDLQLFIKRLRDRIPDKIRYYAVGEYGDNTHRAHYHAILFGVGLDSADLIRDCWTLGFVDVGSCTLESAQYVAGYVVKKMTSKDDPRLNGRYPEFSRMSRKPGLGAGSLAELKSFFLSDIGRKLLDRTGDVPLSLTHGGRALPLGRYLRSKLREELQIQSKGTSDPYFLQQIEQMSALFEASEARSKWQKLAVYQKVNEPKIRSIETRNKIFSSRSKKL